MALQFAANGLFALHHQFAQFARHGRGAPRAAAAAAAAACAGTASVSSRWHRVSTCAVQCGEPRVDIGNGAVQRLAADGRLLGEGARLIAQRGFKLLVGPEQILQDAIGLFPELAGIGAQNAFDILDAFQQPRSGRSKDFPQTVDTPRNLLQSTLGLFKPFKGPLKLLEFALQTPEQTFVL